MAEEQQDSGYFTSIPHGAEWLGQFGLFYSLNAVEEVSFPFWAQFLLKNWHSSVFSIGGEKHIFFFGLCSSCISIQQMQEERPLT